MATLFYAPYLPRGGPERLDWLSNFASALPSLAAKFGLTPAEIQSVQNDYAMLQYARVTLINYARSFSKGVTAFADELDTDPTPNAVAVPVFEPPAAPAEVESGIFKRIDDLVQAKILPTANDTEKTALRLFPLAPASSVVLEITGIEALAHGQVSLTFRRGPAKLIYIYCKRGAEKTFTLIGTVSSTHFLDARPNLVAGQSESREYQIEWSTNGSTGDGNLSPGKSVATLG